MELSVTYIVILAICIITLVVTATALILIIKNSRQNNAKETTDILLKELNAQQSTLRQELNSQTQISVKNMGDILAENQRNFSMNQSEKFSQLEDRLKTFSLENEQKLENIRQTVQNQLTHIQEDNNKQIDEMRKTVDKKLQQTLEEKMTQSFALVNERLEQVYKGLGEMQTLASGVGDLKKVLSNVKTRGILGEIQLGSILNEILSPAQYEENVVTKKGTRNVVEFAVKLPADEDKFIYLPIDSKFPGDSYSALKYIDPPNTTDFAIMFLPFEGLYCEVVNRGLVEVLQRDYKVNVAGPSTMAALLNSLQMGFKTLAVQKRSTEVWKILSDVKKEFDTFNSVLENTQNRLKQANDELEKLVGVRTRQIQRKLKDVQSTDTLPDNSD